MSQYEQDMHIDPFSTISTTRYDAQNMINVRETHIVYIIRIRSHISTYLNILLAFSAYHFPHIARSIFRISNISQAYCYYIVIISGNIDIGGKLVRELGDNEQAPRFPGFPGLPGLPGTSRVLR